MPPAAVGILRRVAERLDEQAKGRDEPDECDDHEKDPQDATTCARRDPGRNPTLDRASDDVGARQRGHVWSLRNRRMLRIIAGTTRRTRRTPMALARPYCWLPKSRNSVTARTSALPALPPATCCRT